MTDTLILFKPLADFGEALKKDCPKNDCTSYLSTYEQYCAIYADYKRVKETIADLSEATVRVLEHAIRKTEAELYKMWFENYAVLKQRAAGWKCEEDTKTVCGGSFAGDRRDPACRFYAVERDRQTGGNTAFGGGGYAAFIPFPALDACAGNAGSGIHTGRGGG